MPSVFSLPEREIRSLLDRAEIGSGHARNLLEKDIWVVETLRLLFGSSFGGDLVFKGGTSLVKAWGALRRFSEDIDITYDIRAFAPDLVGNAGDEALPPTRSQENRWTKAIRRRLDSWVGESARPAVEEALPRSVWNARVRVEKDRLFVDYESLYGGHRFVRNWVMVDFGARATGEPHAVRPVVCDAAAFVPGVSFPEARPAAMLAERTFWEKATSMHVYCHREKGRGDRLSRHWHDAVLLDAAGVAESALADRELARAVARHKAIFFREKDTAGEWIDYLASVSGALRLVPTGAALESLADDHRRMVDSGILLGEEIPFEELMDRCADLEERANRAAR